MVQIKVSTVLLATVIVSLSAHNSVSAKTLNGNVVGYQRSEYQDPVIRAIAQEVLYGRSDLSSLGQSSLTARGLELETREELAAMPRFFRDVGNVVKRFFHGYWRDMEDTAGLFDLREYYQRKQARLKAPPANPPPEESSKGPSKSSARLSTRNHVETQEEAHRVHSTKRLRRRFNNGRMDDGRQPENQMRRRMDFGEIVRRRGAEPIDLKARDHHHLRRRMNFGQMVSRDTDSIESRSPHHLRRRMDHGQMVERDSPESEGLEARNHLHILDRRRMDFDRMYARDDSGPSDLEARNHNPLRRRMEFDQMVPRDSDNLEIRDEELGLLPRMSWFGKSLLIYRDVVNNGNLEGRSDTSLFDRDLIDGLHEEW